jgi:transcriptional regulator with XRE-family HTH domain
MTFGEELRRLMAERGISLHELGRRTNYDPGYLSKVRSGQKRGSRQLIACLDDVLDAGGILIASAEDLLPGRRAMLAGVAVGLAALDPGGRERLVWMRRHPRRIDGATVDTLAAILAVQRHADDVLGSAAVLNPVLAQLAAIEDFVRQAREPVRAALLHVAQQWAEFAAWLFRNTEEPLRARMLYAQTLEWATELGDQTMIATSLVHRCDMAAHAEEVGTVIGLAQAAQRDTTVVAGQRALAAGLEARGYAMAGDGTTAERKLGDVHDLITAMADRPQDQRPWSYWLSPAYFQNEEGIVYGHLADDPRYYRRAVTLLETGYQGRRTAEKPTWGAGSLVHLAAVHARSGDVAQACAVARQASRAVGLAGSMRLAGRLTLLRDEMAARWPGDPRVTELAEALR